jgi:S-DNA-T family DNA segregation ATPase FtsK/SpoIIIE
VKLLVVLVVLTALCGVAVWVRRRFPAVWWLLVGLPVAVVRFRWTYAATMDVCGLTVAPSRMRAFVVRNVARREVQPVPPRVRGVRATLTGLRVRLRLPAGLEPADLAAASERLRHAWGVHAVHVSEVRPGLIELRMTGYDVLARVRLPRRRAVTGRWRCRWRCVRTVRRTCGTTGRCLTPWSWARTSRASRCISGT